MEAIATILTLIILIAFPFAVIYAIYKAIRALMKYNAELKTQRKEP